MSNSRIPTPTNADALGLLKTEPADKLVDRLLREADAPELALTLIALLIRFHDPQARLPEQQDELRAALRQSYLYTAEFRQGFETLLTEFETETPAAEAGTDGRAEAEADEPDESDEQSARASFNH